MKSFGDFFSERSKGSGWPPDTTEGFPASPSLAVSPLTRVRWTICAMLFFATSINYVDRQVLGLLAPSLQHSIGWTEAQYGYIVGAFQRTGFAASGRRSEPGR